MRVAKHVLVARTEGAQAGLDAYLAAPVSKLHGSYKEITSKRTPATRLKAYCNLFGVTEQPQPQTRKAKNGKTTAAPAGATGELTGMFEMFKQFVEQMGGSTPENPADDDDLHTAYITHDEAWAALGSDEAFRAAKGERRNGPATNGQLYRLNERGMLALLDEDDQ